MTLVMSLAKGRPMNSAKTVQSRRSLRAVGGAQWELLKDSASLVALLSGRMAGWHEAGNVESP